MSVREKMILYVTLVLAMGLLLARTVVQPMMEEKQILADSIASYTARLEKLMRVADRGVVVEQNYQALFDQVGKKGSEQQIISRIVTDVQAQAGNYQVQVMNLKPQRTLKEDYYEAYGIQMTVAAEWNDMIKWFYAMQSDPYRFEIEQLRVERLSGERSKLKARITWRYTRMTPS